MPEPLLDRDPSSCRGRQDIATNSGGFQQDKQNGNRVAIRMHLEAQAPLLSHSTSSCREVPGYCHEQQRTRVEQARLKSC